jgi:tRNA-specific 2-thiouridylase
LEDSNDAFRAADAIGAPFYVWDLSEEFQHRVIDDFIEQYSVGRTPNPCLRCNESIKFSALLERATALGFDALCTGHYARVVSGRHGTELHRAVDPDKDQSYVLGVMTEAQIARSIFPLGESTKEQVRLEAAQRGLTVAHKPDSHDICFIPDGDTASWLSQHIPTQPGPVLDAVTGQQVGSHQGAQAFTVGQRRGLALGNPTGDGERRYVVEVDVARNTVLVGPPTLLEVDLIRAGPPTWAGPTPATGDHVEVQVRAHGSTVAGTVHLMAEGIELRLADAIRGVAAGQTAVMYHGTRVVGSATVDRAGRQ